MDAYERKNGDRSTEILRVRKRKNNFMILDKTFSEDPRLSLKSKGILSYLLGKPDGWKAVVKDIAKHCADGEKAIYSGLRELRKYGYYRKRPVRDEKGRRIVYWETEVFEIPIEPEHDGGEKDNGKKDNLKKADKTPENTEVCLLGTFGQIEKSEDKSLLADFSQVENSQVDSVQVQNKHRNNQSNNQVMNLVNIEDNQSIGESEKNKEIEVPKHNGLDRLTDSKKIENFSQKENETATLKENETAALKESEPNTETRTAKPSELSKPEKDGSAGNVRQELIEETRAELIKNNGNISIFAQDNQKMKAAVNILFDNANALTGNSELNKDYSFNLVKKATTQILCSNAEQIKINANASVPYSQVIKEFNKFIECKRGQFYFSWADSFIKNYSQTLPKYKNTIKNIVPYTKAAVLHHVFAPVDHYAEIPDRVSNYGAEYRDSDYESSFDAEEFFQRAVNRALRY